MSQIETFSSLSSFWAETGMSQLVLEECSWMEEEVEEEQTLTLIGLVRRGNWEHRAEMLTGTVDLDTNNF